MRLREPIGGAPIAVALAVAVALLCAACGSSAGASRTATATMTTSMTRTADGNRRRRSARPPAAMGQPEHTGAVPRWRSGAIAATTPTLALISRIARQPTAKWLTGAGQSAQAGRRRDRRWRCCARTPSRSWCSTTSPIVIATGCRAAARRARPPTWRGCARSTRGIGSHPVIVILEPDAIDQAASGCIGTDGAHERYGMLADASKMTCTATRMRASTSMPARRAGWRRRRSRSRCICRGSRTTPASAVNVANFYSTAQSIAYGRRLSRLAEGQPTS